MGTAHLEIISTKLVLPSLLRNSCTVKLDKKIIRQLKDEEYTDSTGENFPPQFTRLLLPALCLSIFSLCSAVH